MSRGCLDLFVCDKTFEHLHKGRKLRNLATVCLSKKIIIDLSFLGSFTSVSLSKGRSLYSCNSFYLQLSLLQSCQIVMRQHWMLKAILEMVL